MKHTVKELVDNICLYKDKTLFMNCYETTGTKNQTSKLLQKAIPVKLIGTILQKYYVGTEETPVIKLFNKQNEKYFYYNKICDDKFGEKFKNGIILSLNSTLLLFDTLEESCEDFNKKVQKHVEEFEEKAKIINDKKIIIGSDEFIKLQNKINKQILKKEDN